MVFWTNDKHLAWSANEQVRQAVQGIQVRKDKRAMIMGGVGLVLVVVFTILSGDWRMFFAFLILIAGLIMLLGSVLD